MHADAAARIERARAEQPFESVRDLARRAQLTRHDLQALAAANALATLSGNRRAALWQAQAAVAQRDLLAAAWRDDATPALGSPSEGQEIVSDYRALGLTLGRHPLALLRPMLLKRRLQPAAALNTYRNGRIARACGLVTSRQRPQTAQGVIFVTLEDETGCVNVVVRPDVFEQ